MDYVKGRISSETQKLPSDQDEKVTKKIRLAPESESDKKDSEMRGSETPKPQ